MVYALEVLVFTLLIAVYVYIRLYDLGRRFAYDYDEGVYLQTAKQLMNGYGLYDPIFLSQPPFLIYTIVASMSLLGESLYAGRLPVALTSIVAGLAAYLLARKLAGSVAGLMSLAVLTLSRVFLHYSRAVEAEIPCATFSIIALLLAAKFIETDRWHYSFASGLSSSIAVLFKFLAAPIVPAILPVFLTREGMVKLRGEPKGSRRLRVRHLIPFIVGGVIPLLMLLPHNLDALHEQLYTYHLNKPLGGTPGEKLSRLIRYLGESPVIMALGFPGILVALASLNLGSMVTALYSILSLLMLVYLPQPLWYHHVATVIPQLSIMSGLTVGYLLNVCRRLYTKASRRSQSRHLRAAAVLLAAFIVVSSLSVYGFSAASFVRRVSGMIYGGGGELEFKVARLIADLTDSSDWIISDSQAIVFVAGRNVPPELCDTSHMRISSGYLVDDEMIALAEAYDVKIVIFWTNRLIRLKRFVEYVEEEFELLESYGKNRAVYIRKG